MACFLSSSLKQWISIVEEEEILWSIFDVAKGPKDPDAWPKIPDIVITALAMADSKFCLMTFSSGSFSQKERSGVSLLLPSSSLV